MPTDDTTTPSPFHAGERAVQARFGLAERVERRGRRVIRDHLIAQHREFYPLLPFLLIGMVDDEDRPWAGLLAGAPGFVHSPDARTLRVDARPDPGDALHPALVDRAAIGVLGIELATRRRNRLTGRVRSPDAGGFAIDVAQSFGNCPQYIQTRTVTPRDLAPGPVHRSTSLDAASRRLVAAADTFFIATAHFDGSAGAGADVSHRGGRPGFVQIEDDGALVFPDFQGNNHFNTLGNLLATPRAGLLFPDFETGDLVQLTGSAEIVWDGPAVDAFPGAQRLLRVMPETILRRERAMALRFAFDAFSPSLEKTGVWGTA